MFVSKKRFDRLAAQVAKLEDQLQFEYRWMMKQHNISDQRVCAIADYLKVRLEYIPGSEIRTEAHYKATKRKGK